MAANFFKYVVHGVAESSDVMATEAGHLENVRVPDGVELDNGSFVVLDGFEANSGDVWTIKAPSADTAADELFLILTSPVIYEDYKPDMQDEKYFYNAEGDTARAYQLHKRDKIALSAECFKDPKDALLKVGSFLDFTQGYKAGVVAKAPTTGPVAEIYDIASNGKFRVVFHKV